MDIPIRRAVRNVYGRLASLLRYRPAGTTAKSLGATIVVALSIFAAIEFGTARRAGAAGFCTYPTDKTYVLENQDCGSVEWELQANYGTIWDEGEAPGYGTCGGDYYNCSCSYVSAYVKHPTESLMAEDDGGGGYYIWWDITDWNEADYESCSSGVECKVGQYGQTESDTSWIDYYEGYDDIWCQYQ
jgi:hypothetical protein